MIAVAIVLGLGMAAGLLLVLDGMTTTASHPKPARHRAPVDHRRWAVSLGAGFVALVLTRWPVTAPAVAALVWFAPHLLGGNANRTAAMERTDAIAGWTEMLRDTINAAHGIEAAITSTAGVAPQAIRSEVRQLSRRITHEPLERALADFADDLAHPIGDLVVAALSAAATHSARDLSELLTTLAAAARDEAAMQLHIDATRARMRTTVRVITGVTVATAAALVLFNPTYVAAYATLPGQVVLSFIIGCWGVALWWLARMGRFDQPERFLIGRPLESTP
ncbi:MAG: hypothetical protein R2733_17320 [Acidimicrobiales bacterium]